MTTLQQFASETNKLAQAQCDAINKAGRLFAARHVEFPESMLEYYFQNGFTPQGALREISLSAGI